MFLNVGRRVKNSVCLLVAAAAISAFSTDANAYYLGRLVRGEWQASWDTELIKDIEDSGLLTHDESSINQICKGYSASKDVREVFWHQLFVSLSWRESLHGPTNYVDFDHGINIGLFQVNPRLNEAYGCSGNLYEPLNNIDCGVKMATQLVHEYNSFIRGSRGGMAAYWQTLRGSSRQNRNNRNSSLREVTRACQTGAINYISMRE